LPLTVGAWLVVAAFEIHPPGPVLG